MATRIRTLQLAVGLMVSVLAPVGMRSCARAPGPSSTTGVGTTLPWRALAKRHYSERGSVRLRLGLLEVGEWTSGCVGRYGPALRFGGRFLQLPAQLETETSFSAMASEGDERVVLAFESTEKVDLLEIDDGGQTFVHLASVDVPYRARLRRLNAADDLIELELKLDEVDSAVGSALSFALGRVQELRSFDRGKHFSSTVGDWVVDALELR